MRPLLLRLLVSLSTLWLVAAQSTTTASASARNSSSTAPLVSIVPTTSSIAVVSLSRSGDQNVPVTTILPTIVNVTLSATPTQTSSESSTATATATVSPTPAPILLQTKLDPAFGVLGTLLILTGLPSTFWGHKNRWTSFFLIGFYTLSLVCLVFIIKFGVIPAVNSPSKVLRGMFVLSCSVAGVAGGAIAIFFWKGAKYFIGAWGGFAFALWVQCFRDGGLISPIGIRWVFYIACGVVGFVACTIPRIHYQVLLISTAAVGASSFILGVDCFTSAGLKEFYVWNIGLQSLFTKYTSRGIRFPVTQTMQIELGLIGAVALMGMAVQLRVLVVLQKKLREITEEQWEQDEEAAAKRLEDLPKELDDWNKSHTEDHPSHNRTESGLSTLPLMEGRRNSGLTLNSSNPHRPPSGLSNYPDDQTRLMSKRAQSPGALPALDLGADIHGEVPHNFIAQEKGHPPTNYKDKYKAQEDTTLQRKEELLAEIQTIRQSIDALKAETSSSEASRRHSLNSRRTLSQDTNSFFLPNTHPRPPRQPNPRGRVQSMDLTGLTQSRASISRPTSAPLRDDDWDSYVRHRKLLQPPSGITAPIPTTPFSIAPRAAIAPAVVEAFTQRNMRENMLRRADLGRPPSPAPVLAPVLAPVETSSEDIPLARLQLTAVKAAAPAAAPAPAPVTILPPTLKLNIHAPIPQRPANPPRTRTSEQLAIRHSMMLHAMQKPLSQEEENKAKVQDALLRWGKANTREKELVNKRLAAKAANLTKVAQKRRSSMSAAVELKDGKKGDHERSLSADKLAALASSNPRASKRLSTMKVEDWQKYQQGVGADAPAGAGAGAPGPSKRDSRALKADESVPFPTRVRRPISGASYRRRVSDPPS